MRDGADPRDRHRPSAVAVAAVAGLGAGLIASFVMERAQALLPTPHDDGADPATEVAAERLHAVVTGTPLREKHRADAGTLVHYALGGALGAAYGMAATFWPGVTRGGGVPFGVASALVLDEVAVPAAGLTKPPWRYPAGTHAYSLLSHAVFGLSLEAARRTLLALVTAEPAAVAETFPNTDPPPASRAATV